MMKKALSIVLTIMLLTTHAYAFTELTKGCKGDEVVALQEILINQGYLSGKADGNFGKMTETAVLAFQKANGIPETGIVDEATQMAINRREEERQSTLVLSSGSKGNDVYKLQIRLIELGYLTGKSTGTYDVNTEAAMLVFQAHNGLTANGIADKVVRDLLYSDEARGIKDPIADVTSSDLITEQETNTSEATEDGNKASEKNESVVIEETEFLFSIPIGTGYSVGEDIEAGTYRIVATDDITSINVKGPGYFQEYLTLWKKGEEARIVLTDGDTFDVEYAALDVYSAAPFSYDDPNDIVVPTGNCYVVGTDIPAGDYSGYAGDESVSLCVYSSVKGEYVSVLNIDAGVTLGKTTLKEGYAITVQSGVLHLTPYQGLVPSNQTMQSSEPDQFLFTIPVGVGYVVGEDIEAGTYHCKAGETPALISIKWNRHFDNLSFWNKDDVARVTLMDGDTVDVEFAPIDVYPCDEFVIDNSEDIVLLTGNRYIVGKDIPAGTYSGYVEGDNEISIIIYADLNGKISDHINVGNGERLGKTILKDGNAITVQSGILHLTPYQGIGG